MGSSSSSFGEQQADTKLAARLKSVEQELSRKESEIAQLRKEKVSEFHHVADSQNAAVHAPPAVNFYGVPISPPGRKNTRNSSDGLGEIGELRNERDAAQEAARSAVAERDGLKSQLANAHRERDKAVNEMMALEKRRQREVEALNDQVDSLRYELNDITGGAGSRAVEKVTLAQARIEELEAVIKEKDVEIQRLELSASTSVHEQPVAEMVSTPQTSEGSGLAKLQRELNATQRRFDAKQREVDDLKLDLKELSDENESLRNGASTGDSEATTQLESELEAKRDEVTALTARLDEATQALQTEKEAYSKLLGAMEVSNCVNSKLTSRRSSQQGKRKR